MSSSCEAQFNEIRDAIDARVNPWLELPDGSECTDPQKSVSTAASIFGASGTGASVQNNGEIVTANGKVSDVLITKIEGKFKPPFLDKYNSQFSNISYGLGAACAILEMNYSAEHKMWPAARDDVANIMQQACDAWATQAGTAAAASGTATLTVIAAVAGAIATVATAGSAAPAVAALVGLSTVATGAMAKIAADAAVSGNSYLSIMESLDTALGKLNTALVDQENALNQMMLDAISTITEKPAEFDLDKFQLGDYAGSDGSITMQEEDAQIVSNNMSRISTALGSASTSLGSAPASNPTRRHYGVGRSNEGTHAAASELYALTAQCLTLTDAEYARGQKLFEATVADYFHTDAEAKKTVNDLIAEEAKTTSLGS
jgi:hypothetical protein